VTRSALVIPVDSVAGGDRAVAGGKAASLGELARAGFRVPPGCVVTTAAFEQAMRQLDPERSIPREVGGLIPDGMGRLAGVTAGIRARIATAPLPAGLRAAVVAAYRALHDGPVAGAGMVPVAVRSSATAEDGADASFAGLQATYLWVRGELEVLDRVRACWASLYSEESVDYRLRRGLPEGAMAMGVVIQRMVDARCSGVMFTRSPATGDRSVIAVEASWGLGSAVVGGTVTPDAYVVNKVTGEILKRTIAAKLRHDRPDRAGHGVLEEEVPEHLRSEPCLSDGELRALAQVGRRVERHYGSAQDVEWAFPRDEPPGGDPFLLQSRPETVWSSRAAAPAATPQARPFDHVLAVLGSAAGGSRGAGRAGGGSGSGGGAPA
jgi:pyruvate,water dikinase